MLWVVFFDVDPFVSNNVTQASGKLTSKIQFTPGLHILIRDKEIIWMSYQHKLLDGCNDTKHGMVSCSISISPTDPVTVKQRKQHITCPDNGVC